MKLNEEDKEMPTVSNLQYLSFLLEQADLGMGREEMVSISFPFILFTEDFQPRGQKNNLKRSMLILLMNENKPFIDSD